jgi:hypothetical protein
MVAESNMRYQDLHATAMYYIRLGAASAMAIAQLWLGEDLTVVELGFPRETSYRQRENLIGEFSAVGDGVLAR